MKPLCYNGKLIEHSLYSFPCRSEANSYIRVVATLRRSGKYLANDRGYSAMSCQDYDYEVLDGRDVVIKEVSEHLVLFGTGVGVSLHAGEIGDYSQLAL